MPARKKEKEKRKRKEIKISHTFLKAFIQKRES
jgi:hypothetical protein